MEFAQHFINLFTESAPYLLLGMLIAGLLHELIPSQWIHNVLGGKNAVVKAALVGAPLPLCSCSVIPVAMGIRRSGASKASTASFLVATPETGVDSVGITYALMGPVMAIVRPIVAVVTAIITGLMVANFTENNHNSSTENSKSNHHCCKNTASAKPASHSWQQKLYNGVAYGFGPLLKDFMLWLLIGLVFAALVQTFVPASFFSQFGSSVWAMLLIVALSVPMYICATASTPIAVGLLMAGISPGAALVFMLTGPATNIATLMVIKQELGKRALMCYLVSVITLAIGSGLLLDHLFHTFNWQLSLSHGQHGDMQNLFYQLCAAILAMLIARQGLKLLKTKPLTNKQV